MSVTETILVFIAIPAAIYGVLGLLTLRSKFATGPRYRPGQEWNYPPVWWSAHPGALPVSHSQAAPDEDASARAGSLGGARGSW